MKVLSENTQGLNQVGKLHNVFCRARRFSVALLQETKVKRSSLSLLRQKWGSDGILLSGCESARRKYKDACNEVF